MQPSVANTRACAAAWRAMARTTRTARTFIVTGSGALRASKNSKNPIQQCRLQRHAET